MSSDAIFLDKKECSECGRQFVVTSPGQYVYKVRDRTLRYQCSYTCYDHALLRLRDNFNKEDKDKWIKKSENTMRAQGKEILHPIK